MWSTCHLNKSRVYLVIPWPSHILWEHMKGKYVRVGLSNRINGVLSSIVISSESLDFRLDIDGLPLYSLLRMQLWPNFAEILRPPFHSIVTFGFYSGSTKPVNTYMQKTIFELQNPSWNYDKTVVCRLTELYSVMPARTYVRQVRSAPGCLGCDKCIQRGSHIEGRMTFAPSNSRSRTDDDFRQRRFQRHQFWSFPFLEVPISMKLSTYTINCWEEELILPGLLSPFWRLALRDRWKSSDESSCYS